MCLITRFYGTPLIITTSYTCIPLLPLLRSGLHSSVLHSGLWFCEAFQSAPTHTTSLLVSSAISFTTTWNPLKRPLNSSALPNSVGKYFIPSSTVRSSSPQSCQFGQSTSWLWLMAYTMDASSSVCYACSLDIVLLWKQKLDKSLRTSLTAADQHVLVHTYS